MKEFGKCLRRNADITLIGGTTGCIVAARLSDADPNLSILVIEGGQNNFQDPSIIHPVLFFGNLQPENKKALFYKSKKEKAIAGRELVVPAGGVLGGGSSINILMYSRAQRHDFDSWKTPGWSADDMVPYWKKVDANALAGELRKINTDIMVYRSLRHTTVRVRKPPTALTAQSRFPAALTALSDLRMIS